MGERREGTREGRKEDLKAVGIKGASVLPPGVLSGELKRKNNVLMAHSVLLETSLGRWSVGITEHTLAT